MRLTLVLLLALISTTSLAQNKPVIDDYQLAITHLKAAKAEIKAVKEDTSTKIDNILTAAKVEIKVVRDKAAKNLADIEALIAKYESALKPQARLKSLEAEYAEKEATSDKKATAELAQFHDSSALQAQGTIKELLNELATSAENVVDLTAAVSVSTEEVGIGTTNLGVKLEVNEDARFNGGGAFDGGSGIQFDLGEIELVSVTETACQTVNFESSFSTVPKVLATINHRSGLGGVHDPMTVWIEEITTTACQICVSDVKSYVDYRSSYVSVYVDWLAIGN
jgi:hypothetical protein